MIDFNKWRMLNESMIGMMTTLGLGKPQAIGGIQGSHLPLDEKKYMSNEEPGEDDEMDDEDDDMEDRKDEEPRKKKKPMKDVDDSEEDDEDEDDEEECDEDKSGVTKPLSFMKKKGMKKECSCEEGMPEKKKHNEESYMKKKKMKKESQEDFFNSFNSYSSPKNQITDETSWWKSLESYAYDPNQKFSDGIKEDCLLPEENPAPGQPGFAPQTRIGFGAEEPSTDN